MSKSSLGPHGTAALVCMVLLPLVVGRAAIALDLPLHSAEVGHWDGYSGEYCDLTSDGQYAYLPNYGCSDNQTARIHIVDISNPVRPPFLANTFFLPPPNEFTFLQDVKVGDGLLFVGLHFDSNEGVAIIDIRDPLNATLVTTLNIAGFEGVHNLFYDNGFLYFPGFGRKVGILDLTALDPDNPPASPITSLTWLLEEVGGTFGVHDITVVDGRLYVAGTNGGLWIYDVSDVANTIPTFLGSVDGILTHSMWPTQDGRFVVTGEERLGGGIQVFEVIEDGGSLTLELRDSFSYPTDQAFSVHNQIIIGNRLYNSWYEKGLQVFDIDPIDGTLTLVSTFDTSDSGLGNWGVHPFLGDEKILVSDVTEGLYVVDITVPTVICGNGGIEGSEECDDGNPDDGDGCSSTCIVETGWDCTGEPSVCTEVCGDGIIVGSEHCDDGNANDGDGCSSTCTIEEGFACTGEPSVCDTDCNGNGVVDPTDIASCQPGDPACADCNGNDVPDECDVPPLCSTCFDCNADGVPDACEEDANGNGIPDECDLLPPVEAPAPHDILKNRYISLDPRGPLGTNPSNLHIRVMVDSSLVNGQVGTGPWWATAPVSSGPADCISVLSNDKPAVEPDWSACPAVHLTGCPIIPTTTYAIVFELDGDVSEEALFDTQAKPGFLWYGDCVGFFDGTILQWTAPNGVVNAADFQAVIFTFQDPNAFNATHMSLTDMVPNLNGTQINLIVNINDVFSIIKGFQGFEYPGADLTMCDYE